MCEIAIVNPREESFKNMVDQTMAIYRTQRSSLGLVAVYHNSDENKLNYNIFKAVNTDNNSVSNFIRDNNNADWLIIHGRMATSGGVSVKTAHPIHVDCENCNIDHILHNGVVGKHQQTVNELERDGHTISTNVDTEVIAHRMGDVPDLRHDELSDYDYAVQPAYILLNNDRMFIFSTSKYVLNGDGYMSSRHRSDFGPDETDDDYTAVTITA